MKNMSTTEKAAWCVRTNGGNEVILATDDTLTLGLFTPAGGDEEASFDEITPAWLGSTVLISELALIYEHPDSDHNECEKILAAISEWMYAEWVRP